MRLCLQRPMQGSGCTQCCCKMEHNSARPPRSRHSNPSKAVGVTDTISGALVDGLKVRPKSPEYTALIGSLPLGSAVLGIVMVPDDEVTPDGVRLPIATCSPPT